MLQRLKGLMNVEHVTVSFYTPLAEKINRGSSVVAHICTGITLCRVDYLRMAELPHAIASMVPSVREIALALIDDPKAREFIEASYQ
jgi:hypothetical protein